MPSATYSLHRLAWGRVHQGAVPVSAVIEDATFEACMRAARREPAERWLGLYDADGRMLAFRTKPRPEAGDWTAWTFQDWVPDA